MAEEQEAVPSAAYEDIKPAEEQECTKEVKSSNFDNALGEIVDKFFANVETEVTAKTSAKKNKPKPNKEK